MFENCSVMIYTNSDNIFRINTDSDTQNAICCRFSNLLSTFDNKQEIKFDGNYKTEDDEVLVIDNFHMYEPILDAIRDPMSIENAPNEVSDIKFIFMGEKYDSEASEEFNIIFQKFKKEQYITPQKFNLFFAGNTYVQDTRFGITLNDNIDCHYKNGTLLFSSYFFARQIFNLQDYYRSATNIDVDMFIKNDKLIFESSEGFKKTANTYIRRKIAMIQDSKILEKYTVEYIKEKSSTLDIQMDIQEGKIVIPNDREKAKVILGFLDEEAYKGPFSQATFLANSKRRLSR